MILRRVALMAMGVAFALLAGELLFRLVPFERLKYEARYGHFSGNEVSRFLEYDPALTFRNRRGAEFPDAGVTINSLGLRGTEVRPRKRPGSTRILALGDSCTFGGGRPYPGILQRRLDRRFGEGRFEVLNAGVIGYTSLHGLEWLERELLTLEPDVVTIYFGWNDLWREKDSAIREWFRRRVRHEKAAFRSHLLEALQRGAGFLRNRLDPGDVPIQIPPSRYREVLERYVDLGRRHGFTPVFVTAPAGFRGEETPRWLVEKGFVAPDDSAPELRRRYNDVVRQVAASSRAPLADCAADFARAGALRFFARPDEDPIHPNDRGYARIARVLEATILREVIAASPSADRASR